MESSNEEEVGNEDTALAAGQVIQKLAATVICLSRMPGRPLFSRIIVHVDGWVKVFWFSPRCGEMHLFWNSTLATCLGDLGRSKIFHSSFKFM